jgi:hypothetical protein
VVWNGATYGVPSDIIGERETVSFHLTFIFKIHLKPKAPPRLMPKFTPKINGHRRKTKIILLPAALLFLALEGKF